MKKIPVWKVILLSIVTLGIYTVIWFALRRDELIKNYDQKLPHWLWLVIPPAVTMVLGMPLTISTVFFVKDPAQATLLMTVGFMILVCVPFVISVWWVNRFGMSVAKITKERVPTMWTTLLYIFWGPVVIAVHQYYFNHYPIEKIPAKDNNVGPSRKFVVISTIAIALSLLGTGAAIATFPADYEATQQEITNTRKEMTKDADLLKEAEKLLVDYNACIDQLKTDFPGELLPEDEARYNDAYDRCEEIRKKQWEAADKYNKR